MRLGELFSLAGLECPQEYSDIQISKIVTDSREVSDGCIFVAIRGYNTDGHEHIDKAIKNGAAVVVAEQVRDGCVGGAAIVKVDNTRRVAAQLYNAQCGFPSKKMKIVGVTGTNGKTSVCFMLESIFIRAGIPCAVIGTLGCRVNGEPLTLCGEGLTTPDSARLYPLLSILAERGIKYVFMEVSSHALALERVAGLDFEYGIFTNLTQDHLDFHGTMEEYFLTKASFFGKCRKKIINVDCPYGKRLYGMYRGSLACSQVKGDFVAKDIRSDRSGNAYTLLIADAQYAITLAALGDFSAFNSLEAAALALNEKISPEAIVGGLSRFSGVSGRMERVAADAPFDVFIDYAHTPDALERLLMNARALRGDGAKTVLVFGCGGERDRGKRKQMANIASRLADTVVITSDNSRREDPEVIFSDILKGVDKEKPYSVIPSRREAIEYALSLAREGDVVVLAGKGHEKYEIDADGKHFFDEREIVREAINKKL